MLGVVPIHTNHTQHYAACSGGTLVNSRPCAWALGVRMIKVILVTFALSVSSSMVLAEEVPCWADHDAIPETSQVSVLKTHLLPIRLESPQSDLDLRLEHQDYRFIAIGAFGVTYPGLKDKELLCVHGYRYITGTSDAIESKEHSQLVQAFTAYAVKYNTLLEARLSGK